MIARATIAAAVLAAALPPLAAVSAGAAPEDGPVILITVDTLRADRIGAYGYAKAETPVTDSLSSQGVTFERAIAQTPMTLPSHATILTGTYPLYHRVQDVVGHLPPEVPTLAEWFQGQNYRTAAFVAASVLSADWGLDRGFDRYDDEIVAAASPSGRIDLDRVERTAGDVVDRVLEWLAKQTSSRFFLWVHLFDPHDPYAPPEPFATRFKDRPYDGEIAYVDQQLGRLMDALTQRGFFNPSLIVFTADHGESLGEHGERYHAFFLYDCSLHVPLILKLPQGGASQRVEPGVRVANQVRSVDIAPTIVQIVGQRPPASMQGEGLLAYMLGRRGQADLPAYSETHYPRIHFGWAPLFSLSNGKNKFIQAPQEELYDLSADPGERSSLAATWQALANQLETQLREIRRKYRPPQEPGADAAASADAETLARLRSLGYVAFAAGGGASEDYSGLADPKQKIDTYNRLNAAIELTRAGDSTKALAILEKVAAQEPAMPLVHFLMGTEYAKSELFLKAIEQFRLTLEHNPDSHVARFNLARSYLAAGLRERAAQELQTLVRDNPQHWEGRQLLARLLAKDGKLEEAVAQQKTVLEQRPGLAEGHNNLGAYLFSLNRYPEAADSYRKALEIDPGHREARLNLCLVYLVLQRWDEALSEGKIAVRYHPQAPLAHFYLGKAYLAKGLRSEAEEEFSKAKSLDPKLPIPSTKGSSR